ncbi:hypothetical protein Pan153_60900 [Gimesia panareensis]|uniref:Prepilin-type N-terminal cleavage/methylation domain-containing protein n=1 Tax=Gimesia panareensis TaxID=2527978 RepID=A0A518FYF6_9PLAN|nr:type II secretion system protein [Gimesia panareensis]QDV21402.1 hypothetical protein Pan153_60900 [Gimesia panareensis]
MKKSDSKKIKETVLLDLREGFTLIEMLAVMATMSILFTVAVTTLAFLMRVEMQGTERIQDNLILQKLSHQFRMDVATARQANLKQDNQKQLNLDRGHGTSIVYFMTQSGDAMRREIRKEGKLISREEYRLHLSDTKFEIDQQELVSLELQIPEETNHENKTLKPLNRVFRCESHLNHQNRFLNQSAESR